MAIVNRDLAPSQQCSVVGAALGAVATGVTSLIALIPNSCQVIAAGLKAYGLSGSPQYSLNLLRTFTAGNTLIPLGATLTATGGTTNVVQSFSLTLGATVFAEAGDVLMLNSGVSNTAVTGLVVSVVLKPLQDVKTYYGVSAS